MKKILCCLLLICLMGCESKEKVIIPPTSDELGNVCTIVSEFDNDIYNISLFYTENENYPILNKDDFNYINQLALRYSDEGSKDVSKYKINQTNAYKLCEMENANVVNIAIQISDSNYLTFMSELRKYEVSYQVEKEEEVFKVAMPNNVISTTSLEINYTRVYSQAFSEDEIQLLKEIKFETPYNISLDENHYIQASTIYPMLIKEDGKQEYSQFDVLVGLGAGVQLFVEVGADESISADSVPVLTLAKLLKSDVTNSTYFQLNNHYYMTSELKEYILYETDQYVIYDLNPYLYGNNLKELYANYVAVNSVETPTYEITSDMINEEEVIKLYNDVITQVKSIIK